MFKFNGNNDPTKQVHPEHLSEMLFETPAGIHERVSSSPRLSHKGLRQNSKHQRFLARSAVFKSRVKVSGCFKYILPHITLSNALAKCTFFQFTGAYFSSHRDKWYDLVLPCDTLKTSCKVCVVDKWLEWRTPGWFRWQNLYSLAPNNVQLNYQSLP